MAKGSTEEVRAWLDERLPAHMVPERILMLSRPLLTSNGKVDRKTIIDLLE